MVTFPAHAITLEDSTIVTEDRPLMNDNLLGECSEL